MRYRRFSIAIASLAPASLEVAAASAPGGGGRGVNWYLRARDGSSQGPYRLAQLGEWSSAGYVALDTQVQWGPGGAPQPLSGALGAGGGGMGASYGGDVSESEDGGRRGDDDTSEEGGYDYRAAEELWAGQGSGDDSEDEPYRPPGGERGARPGGARDQWGSSMQGGVNAVEGGRWAESVTAAKGTFKKMFTVNSRNSRYTRGGQGGGGRSRGAGSGRGGRYPQGERGGRGGGGGREGGRGGYSQGRGPYSGGNPGQGYGGLQGYGGRGGRGGTADSWNTVRRGVPISGQGEQWGGGRGPSAGAHPGVGPGEGDPWSNQHGTPPPPGQQGQPGASGAGAGGGAPLPGGFSSSSPAPPPPPAAHSPGQEWQQQDTQANEGGPAFHPPPPDQQHPPPGHNSPPSGEGAGGYHPPPPMSLPDDKGLSEEGGVKELAPPPPPPPPVGESGGADVLDPKDVEAFFAAQVEYGHSGSGASGAAMATASGESAPKKTRRWGRGEADVSKEDLSAMGLDYGEPDREGASRDWFFPNGGRDSLTGKISVDSMKRKYEEGWLGKEKEGGLFARLKDVAGKPVSCVSRPIRVISSATPIAVARMLVRAGGLFPLLLWWESSVAEGVFPVIIAWLASMLVRELSETIARRPTFSSIEFMAAQLRCVKLVEMQGAAGIWLALVIGIVRGWLRPRAKELSAALGRRALAGACVSEGRDRPRVAEFRELSLAPWAYMCEGMALCRGLGRLSAATIALGFVWPLLAPAVFGGGAAILLVVELLVLWLTGAPSLAPADADGSFAEEDVARGIQSGAIASAEADARGLRQVLLEKHASVLKAAEQAGRQRVLTAMKALRGVVAWVWMGGIAMYSILSVVQEELTWNLGSDRVMLAFSLVWLSHAGLRRSLHSLGQLASLRWTASRMAALALDSGESSGVSKDTGRGTEGGWTTDGPEIADGLRLEGVSFTPNGRSAPALSQVDLHAPAGSMMVVLGGAGSGKTALIQLVLGEVKACEGEAMFQGRPLAEWETGAYRERVAWLNQVSARFSLTAGENIGAGDASAFSDRQLWHRAAGVSGASTAIESLPAGYDTPLKDGGGPASAMSAAGSTGSSGLSEGEWQMLLLSRFLMRADLAKLLVLDEPFKGISPRDASRMLTTLRAQARARGQVLLVASQDLSIGRWADTVVLLESGSVVEAGAWDDLLARGGSLSTAVRERDAF